MDNPLISVIVPIYKVEPYLRRCLDSIVNQTYTNLEIILVDDGSPDGCPAICDEYAAKDSRIIVIHKENGGLSDARNAGLDICKGEYISFVDSDDWIADCFIEVLFKSIQDTNAEIGICGYIQTSSSYTTKYNVSNVIKTTLSSIEATTKLWSKERITYVTVWGKLYNRFLWKNVRFPKGLIHEDEYTSYILLYNAKKTVCIDIPLYYYYQRLDSIMAGARPSSIRVLKARWERYEYFRNHQEKEIVDLCLNTLCWDLLFAYNQVKIGKKNILGFKDAHDILKKYRISVKDFEKSSCKSAFHLIALKLFALIPSLYLTYRKISPTHLREI